MMFADEIDHEATPERRLIASIVYQAVADLGDRGERDRAYRWLTDERSTCPAFLRMLDIDPGQFRKRVAEYATKRGIPVGRLSLSSTVRCGA